MKKRFKEDVDIRVAIDRQTGEHEAEHDRRARVIGRGLAGTSRAHPPGDRALTHAKRPVPTTGRDPAGRLTGVASRYKKE